MLWAEFQISRYDIDFDSGGEKLFWWLEVKGQVRRDPSEQIS